MIGPLELSVRVCCPANLLISLMSGEAIGHFDKGLMLEMSVFESVNLPY